MKRFIDHDLKNWAQRKEWKPILMRGARQVGKTYAVRQLGKSFENFTDNYGKKDAISFYPLYLIAGAFENFRERVLVLID